MSPAILAVNNIYKSYGKTVAVRDLSFTLGKGEILALLGPNGAGKTTTIRIIGGVLRPDRGRIIINGKDMTDKASLRKRIMGIMTEEPSLFPDLPVKDSLSILCRLYSIDKNICNDQIKELSNYFNVASFLPRKYAKLSMGLKRIFDYISSIIHDPEIVLLDEPFNAIDVERKNLIKKNIIKLSREGKAIIITSHNIPETMDLSNKVIILKNGERVLETTPSELMTKYPIEEQIIITTKKPIDPSTRTALEREGFRVVGRHGVVAYYRRSRDLPALLSRAEDILSSNGNGIDSVRMAGTPWDKIFIRIYRKPVK